MILYTQTLDDLSEDMLKGFFVGWSNPPHAQSHIEILKNSYCVWLAIDENKKNVVGFITAISDGIISAYIPLFEVLPEYQNRGIGKGLITRMIDSLRHLYMVDLVCDEHLKGYYDKFGMSSAAGLFLRNYEKQNCEKL